MLSFRDDLSCGPIDAEDAAVREAWWNFEEEGLIEQHTKIFWNTVATTKDRLVVWFARHSARELAFFLSWADRLGDRPYEVVDVTGLELPYRKRDGSQAVTRPVSAVSSVPTDALGPLLGTERAFAPREREAARQAWQRLKSENAPFRIVTAKGLLSAPADHFDQALLDCATVEWQRSARVIGDFMGRHWEPYHQVHDLMLRARVVALVESGKLIADGDAWDTRTCRVRLPD